MKKVRNKSIKLVVLGIISIMLLSGCGSETYENSNMAKSMDYSEDLGVYEDDCNNEEIVEGMDVAAGANSPVAPTSANQSVLTNRKLIKNITLTVETETYETLFASVDQQIEELGGYIEHLYAGDSSYEEATIIARIPSERLDEFVKHVEDSSNITQRNESVEDVTLNYADTEGRKAMYQAEQKKLIELVDKAETIEDIIVIETRLSEVSYQIEELESKLRTFDNLIDYSTVTLYIREVERYTPQVETGVFEKIKLGLNQNLYEIKNGTTDFLINFVVNIPYLLLWAVIIVMIIVTVKILSKKAKKKKGFRHQINIQEKEGNDEQSI